MLLESSKILEKIIDESQKIIIQKIEHQNMYAFNLLQEEKSSTSFLISSPKVCSQMSQHDLAYSINNLVEHNFCFSKIRYTSNIIYRGIVKGGIFKIYGKEIRKTINDIKYFVSKYYSFISDESLEEIASEWLGFMYGGLSLCSNEVANIFSTSASANNTFQDIERIFLFNLEHPLYVCGEKISFIWVSCAASEYSLQFLIFKLAGILIEQLLININTNDKSQFLKTLLDLELYFDMCCKKLTAQCE